MQFLNTTANLHKNLQDRIGPLLPIHNHLIDNRFLTLVFSFLCILYKFLQQDNDHFYNVDLQPHLESFERL